MMEAEAEATMATKAAIPHITVLNFKFTSSAMVKLCCLCVLLVVVTLLHLAYDGVRKSFVRFLIPDSHPQ